MNVKNQACIRRLSRRNMRAAKTRNLIAVIAIALTAVLFTSLFTIAMSLNESFQQANFRQVGGYSHGGFKYLTEEQFLELREDPLIKEWGVRRVIGVVTKEPLNKNHVEVSWCDEKEADWMYCSPTEGSLPREGTNEAATDLEILTLLGVEPKIGAEFTVPIEVEGKETEQTFVLSGWWEKDPLVVANHILIPESRVNAVLEEMEVVPPGKDGMTGAWNMDVMLGGSMKIEDNLRQILTNHGYQTDSMSEERYINIGVNWGYTGAQMVENFDPVTVGAVVTVLLLIILTGYLIIYNVFQISVANDIRFYGLLKTIGTTGRQIKRIIRMQALLLSAIGVPLGLLAGWLVGAKLTPVVADRMDGIGVSIVSVHPVIFVVSAVFALITVLISCRKPGKMAARVSPVEAVRYTEQVKLKKKVKKLKKKLSLLSMARANLGRSRGKTTVTVISLALAIVLLNLTVTFTNGFDMDKYLRTVVADGIFGRACYFQVTQGWDAQGLPEEVIEEIAAQPQVTDGGRIYGKTTPVLEYVSEDYWKKKELVWDSEERVNQSLALQNRNEEGQVEDRAQLYGMEKFALDKLKVVEGDLSKLDEPGKKYIAAVLSDDDYGETEMDSHWAKVGETVTLRYVDEFEYYNFETGEILDMPEEEIPVDIGYGTRPKTWRDVEYEVAALVVVPTALSYRYYGADEFVLNADTFMEDTQSNQVMTYVFDTKDQEASLEMDEFLTNYTENVNTEYDFESKQTYVAEFESFRSMFLMLGGTLSFIVGLVGVLNFFNAILTGIITRKREFAMLQSIGMTGKQLKLMLVWEGMFYALGAVGAALLLSMVICPLAATVFTNMFWFFSYKFTVMPAILLSPVFAALGALIPLALYRQVAKKSVVERLRESE